MKRDDFLPVNHAELCRLGVERPDVIIVTGDAYIDHPAFGAAIIGRFLESLGLTVGIIPQPDWRSADDFMKLGRPKLFFGVTAGNLDSMAALYTAQRKIRSDDPYSEYGKAGKKPYLPTVVYTQRIKEAYKGVPVILGGIEASLRRIAHYDFYRDIVRPSILLDSKADMLAYGNAEAPLKEIVSRMKNGENPGEMKNIRGTVIPLGLEEIKSISPAGHLPSFADVKTSKKAFSQMTRLVYSNLNPWTAVPLLQQSGSRAVLVNPPAFPLLEAGLDRIYGLPFLRAPHPSYRGEIPAFTMIKNSITSHRGCYGGCSFCALSLHQGKHIQSRSRDSIRREASIILDRAGKETVISDIGGPTANMYGSFCREEKAEKICQRKSCLYPSICSKLDFSQDKYISLLSEIRSQRGIRAVNVNSGIRTDIAALNPDFIEALVKYYTPGQLSCAPEHCEESILKIMGKPGIKTFDIFLDIFRTKSRKEGKELYIIPYFIIGHPGSSEKTERRIAGYLAERKLTVRQVQEFYPTPMTISTSIYYTGEDPFTGEKIYSEKKLSQKKRWKQFLL